MSYEGYQELLCENGHYCTRDAYDSESERCPRCYAVWAYRHSVDQTNGMDDGNPHTMPAPREEIGFDEVWNVDHHGNEYATKILRFKPLSEWTKLVLVDVAPDTKVYCDADYFEHEKQTG